MDVERERRARATRSSMLIRRFARFPMDVQVTLYKTYCQSFYIVCEWHTQKAYSAQLVQNNNAFRVLLGLSRHCNVFAEVYTDGSQAVIRKRQASSTHTSSSSSSPARTKSLKFRVYSHRFSPVVRPSGVKHQQHPERRSVPT